LILPFHLRNRIGETARFGWSVEHGAQIVEFAVALPLLVLFVVGIFDFSNAFTLKQKLTNIARDAARTAAADPANDLQSFSTSAPISVIDAFQVVDNNLIANNINDCGVTQASGTSSGLTWQFSVVPTSTSPCGITLTVNRGYYFAAGAATQTANVTCQTQSLAGGPTQTAVIGTCVSIQYGYQWRFGRVASVLGVTSSLPSAIIVTAVAMNEN
jgi:Flp pilus assembly protein TadG